MAGSLTYTPGTNTSVETGPQPPSEQPTPKPARGQAAAVRGWRRRDTLLLVAIVVFAAALRVPRLAEPNAVVFDETYYAKDACLYLGHTQQFCGVNQATEQSYVHPPLGKWLISAGIRVFGYNSFGWRISAAVFGAAMAGVAFLLARKLFKDRWTAAVAGFLVAADFLLIVQSRIAMLDIFLSFFVLLGFLFLVFDREKAVALKQYLEAAGGHEDDKKAERPPGRGPGRRFASGVAFGLAMSVKWSAVLALVAGAVAALLWSLDLAVAQKKSASVFGPRRLISRRRELGVTLLAFVVTPWAVYLAAHSPYFVDRFGAECPYTLSAKAERVLDVGPLSLREGACVKGAPGAFLSFADLQGRVLDYHATLKAKHTYQSKAWTWPLLLRPVAYHFESSAGKSSEVLAVGNPAAWYGALLALLWLAARSLKGWRPERLVVLAWGAQYLPWLIVSRPLFLFYMTPAVPFMMVGLAAALSALRKRGRVGRTLVTLYLVVGVAAMLVFFYPVIESVALPEWLWRRHMWIPQFKCGGFDCGWI